MDSRTDYFNIFCKFQWTSKSLLTLFFVLCLAICCSSCSSGRGVSEESLAGGDGGPDLEHVVQFPGESLSLIAQWYTGRMSNWLRLVDRNPGLEPERIVIGQTIIVPGELIVERDPLPESAVQESLAKRRAIQDIEAVEFSAERAVSDEGSVQPEAVPSEKVVDAKRVPEEDEDISAFLLEEGPKEEIPADALETGEASEPEEPIDEERERLLDELLSE